MCAVMGLSITGGSMFLSLSYAAARLHSHPLAHIVKGVSMFINGEQWLLSDGYARPLRVHRCSQQVHSNEGWATTEMISRPARTFTVWSMAASKRSFLITEQTYPWLMRLYCPTVSRDMFYRHSLMVVARRIHTLRTASLSLSGAARRQLPLCQITDYEHHQIGWKFAFSRP